MERFLCFPMFSLYFCYFCYSFCYPNICKYGKLCLTLPPVTNQNNKSYGKEKDYPQG